MRFVLQKYENISKNEVSDCSLLYSNGYDRTQSHRVESCQKGYRSLRNRIIFWNGPGRWRSAAAEESQDNNIAASVRIGIICAEVHNSADKTTLAALFRTHYQNLQSVVHTESASC